MAEPQPSKLKDEGSVPSARSRLPGTALIKHHPWSEPDDGRAIEIPSGIYGNMAEWSNALVLKTGAGESWP